jgi:glycosyltransferase involved in cell wall biosynthesis
MKKRRIVLASILKPVDDTRMFEKMATALAWVGEYEIFVIGFPTKEPKVISQNITQIPLKKFTRISIGRLLAPLKVLNYIYKVKPEVLIVNTHELLLVSFVNRIFFGVYIVYDIRENYWRNILNTTAFPSLLRPAIAGLVRLKEKVFAPLFHAFILAEKTYESELEFVRGKSLIVENKTLVPVGFIRTKRGDKISLLFSGTLAESTGVFEAIELSKKLHQIDSRIELTIIGFCALAPTLFEVKKSIQNFAFISLIGGGELVPHAHIFKAIAAADFGIICYPPSSHIENRIPTKLYEYLACKLPIILTDYPPWVEICKPYQAALPINMKDYNPEDLLRKMLSNTFYTSEPTDVTWASEEPKLLNLIAQFLT